MSFSFLFHDKETKADLEELSKPIQLRKGRSRLSAILSPIALLEVGCLRWGGRVPRFCPSDSCQHTVGGGGGVPLF